MGTSIYPVRLINSAGEAAEGTFCADEDVDGDLCRLTFRFSLGEYQAAADDYFEAMCEIRSRLEGLGWRPLCYGGSRNVFPSGMSRNMGSRGQTAYKLRLGHPARQADLVRIFDAGPDVEPVSVGEQAAFYNLWLRSLRQEHGDGP